MQAPHENGFHDDEDDGELWDYIEPTEIDKDICGDSSAPFNIDHDTVDTSMQTSQSRYLPAGIRSDLDDEPVTNKASKLVNFLLVLTAKWSSRHNITSSAVVALLRIIGVLFTILEAFSSTIADI